MRDKKTVPVFNSEAEEAQWWFDNRETFARDLKQALADGTAGVGTVARRMRQATVALELDPADVALARSIAARKGVDYEIYMKQMIHAQLEREMSQVQAQNEMQDVA